MFVQTLGGLRKTRTPSLATEKPLAQKSNEPIGADCSNACRKVRFWISTATSENISKALLKACSSVCDVTQQPTSKYWISDTTVDLM
ncbi:hypothetical protein T265_05622 [Opisthorchis viverrini]|uniref:Uncharacterized protein n=1 Tax=Opisthorchis viverrini TaxID=6198 RepID=A0A074ZNF7_OPIVI|nr:hypothetical protein T265_05622 [Opisthorchis viverrini]KER27297.1 hypothetical protein T265_05622 [Opisthorchis viverrini]